MDFAAAAAGFEGIDVDMFRQAMAQMVGTAPLGFNFSQLGRDCPGEQLSAKEIASLKARITFGEPLLTHKKIGQHGAVFAGIPLPSILSAPLDEFDALHQTLRSAPASVPKVPLQDVMEAYPFPCPGREPFPMHRGRNLGHDMYNHADLRWLVRDRLKLQDLSMLGAADPAEAAKRHTFLWAPETLLTGHPYLMMCAASCSSPPSYAAQRDADVTAVLSGAFQLSHPRLLRLSQELQLRCANEGVQPPCAEASIPWEAHAVPDSICRWLGGGGPSPQAETRARSNATRALLASQPSLPQTFADCVHLLMSALDVHSNLSVMMAWGSSGESCSCRGTQPGHCRHCEKMDKLPQEYACVTYEALAVCHVQSAHCCAHEVMTPLPSAPDSPRLLPLRQAGGQPSDIAFSQYSVIHNGALVRLEAEPFLELLNTAADETALLRNLRELLLARWNLSRTAQHILSQGHINAACAYLAAVGVPRRVVKAAVRAALRRSTSDGAAREEQVLYNDASLVDIVAHICDRQAEQHQAHAKRSKLQKGVLLRRDLLRAATAARGAKAGSRQARAAHNRVLALRLELGLMLHTSIKASTLMSMRGQALAAVAAPGASAPVAPLNWLPVVTEDLTVFGDADEVSCQMLNDMVAPFDSQCGPPTFLYGNVAGMNIIAMETNPLGAPLHARALLLRHEGLQAHRMADTVGYRWLKCAADVPDPSGRGGFMVPLSREHPIGTDLCYTPSLYHWGIIALDDCQMRGRLFVGSGFEDLQRGVPALVFRPGISGRLLHPSLLRPDTLSAARLSKLLFCAFYVESGSTRSFLEASPRLLKMVAPQLRLLQEGVHPTALTDLWHTFLSGLFGQRTEVWMHTLHSISGVHLEPTLPTGSCCPYPDEPEPFPTAQAQAQRAAAIKASARASNCSYERLPVDATKYSVLDITVEHNVFLGRYRCKRHGREVPVNLLDQLGPSREACVQCSKQWTNEGQTLPLSTLGANSVVLPGGLIITEFASRALFKGLMHAAKAAVKQGCCIWDAQAPTHPLAVYLQMQLSMWQPRLVAHLPELNTYLRSLEQRGISQGLGLVGLSLCISRQVKAMLRFLEQRMTPAVCIKAAKLSFAVTHGGAWPYFQAAGWPVFPQAHRNLHVSDDLLRRMITSECHKYPFGAGGHRDMFRQGRARPYRATFTPEFEAKHQALWFGGGSD